MVWAKSVLLQTLQLSGLGLDQDPRQGLGGGAEQPQALPCIARVAPTELDFKIDRVCKPLRLVTPQ